jgi:hypothetical protein
VVSGGGEHHNAADAALDFLGDCDRIYSLRLHPQKPRKKPLTETVPPAARDEHQPGCFALEDERGGSWKGSGVPVIKEAKPSL